MLKLKIRVQSNDAKHASLVQTANYCGQYVSIFRHSYEKNRHVPRTVQTLQRIEDSGIPAGKTGHWNNTLLPVPSYPLQLMVSIL